MNITLVDPGILISSGAVFRKYEKGRVIFHEGDIALYYFQIISGTVSMENTKDDGSRIIADIFEEGQSFGTTAVFIDEPLPATAIAHSDTKVVCIGRQAFLKMLKKYPDVLLNITNSLCRKLHQKAFIGNSIASQGPEGRISTLLQSFRKEKDDVLNKRYLLMLSRQQIADMIGLRVETVIRAIKKLETKGSVTIEHGKVYY